MVERERHKFKARGKCLRPKEVVLQHKRRKGPFQLEPYREGKENYLGPQKGELKFQKQKKKKHKQRGSVRTVKKCPLT